MKRVFKGRSKIFTLSLIVTLLTGCFSSSPSSRFYTLSSLKSLEPDRQTAPSSGTTIVAVGPLAIPDYLDRQELVTRPTPNEIRVHEFNRWAGSLENDILRVTIEDLSVMLPADRFSVVRWASATQMHAPITYRVMVDVLRFDVSPGKAVLLEADWTIYEKEKETKAPLIHKTTISEQISGKEFYDMAAAMSRAIEKLSRVIAEQIASVDRAADSQTPE